MRLFEFADNDPLRVKLVAVSNQLDQLVQGQTDRLSTDEFLQMLRQNGVVIGKSDLFDIVKKEPLSNIIANVNGEQIVFKSQEPEEVDQDADENAKIRQQMASKQANKM